MSIFVSLAEEHALMLDLVARLERAAADTDPRSGGRDTRKLLLILLQALEAHEDLEHLVFDVPTDGPANPALALVERQHRALAALRAEAAGLLEGLPGEDAASMRGLTRRMTRLLRRHFEDEERMLWPTFYATAGRSRLHGLERQARAQVRAMEKDIEGYLTAVEHYLT